MAIDKAEIKLLIEGIRKEKRVVLFPAESEAVVGCYGIDLTKSVFSGNDLDEILRTAEEMGCPVALKLISQEMLHKSDAGCVQLNLNNHEEITRAYHSILQNIGGANSKVQIEGFLVQEMIQDHHEVIVGLASDLTFGKIIMFGLGGLFVEILKDVAIRKIPITPIDARDMIEEIKGFKVLQGARGKEPANLNLLQEILMKTSCLGQEIEEIKEMDLNPVFVNSQNALVADPKIILDS